MEWNDERTQLHLTHVTGAAQSRSNYLVYLLSHSRSFMSKFGVAHRHASVSKQHTHSDDVAMYSVVEDPEKPAPYKGYVDQVCNHVHVSIVSCHPSPSLTAKFLHRYFFPHVNAPY